MRRPLSVLALALVLFGFEVATGIVSLAAVRLWTGFEAFLSGNESVVSAPRYFSGLALILLGVAVYVSVLLAESARRRIEAAGDACPNCGMRTRRVHRRRRHRMMARLLESGVTRRHCGRCGWSGLAT